MALVPVDLPPGTSLKQVSSPQRSIGDSPLHSQGLLGLGKVRKNKGRILDKGLLGESCRTPDLGYTCKPFFSNVRLKGEGRPLLLVF